MHKFNISEVLNPKRDLQTFDKRIYEKIVDTLRGIQNKYGKNYCFPSQETILKLLRRNQQTIISRRTLNRHLRALDDMGVIQRIRRYKESANNKAKTFLTTAYYICEASEGLIFQAAKALRRISGHSRVTEMAHYLLKKKNVQKKGCDVTAADVKHLPEYWKNAWKKHCSGAAVSD